MKKKDGEVTLSFYYWICARLYNNSHSGYLKNSEFKDVIRKFNIPKRLHKIIIEELKSLKILSEEKGIFKIEKLDEDEIIKSYENKLLYDF